MENIYHFEITAILEETHVGTVTNARQGLNAPPFDLKSGINETIRGNCWAVPFTLSRNSATSPTLIFNTYIHDKWLRIHFGDLSDDHLFVCDIPREHSPPVALFVTNHPLSNS